MAHRMFNSKIIEKSNFLKMPLSSQALYFHLGMSADDDGIAEAYKVMRLIGANEDDLRVLAARSFIKVLNEEQVVYIMDWNHHNKIRTDRKVDSIYQELLIQVLPQAEIRHPKNKLSDKCQTNDRQLSAEDKLSKVNISYVSSACAQDDNEKANADEAWEVDLNNPEPMNVHDDLTINTSHRLIQPLVATIRKYSKRPIVDAISPALITSCEANLQKVYDLCKKTGNDYNDYMIGQLNYSMNSRKLEQSTVIVRTLSDIASASIRYLQTLDAKKQAEPDVVPLHKPEPEEKPLTPEQQKELAEMIAKNRRGEL